MWISPVSTNVHFLFQDPIQDTTLHLVIMSLLQSRTVHQSLHVFTILTL